MQQSVARITTRYQGRDKVRVYYELWYQPLRTLGSDPWLNDLITRCGGVNVFNHLPQSFPLISVEAVLKKDPDLILSPATNMEQSWHDHWSDWPGLKAVKTNSVAYINADWVHRYTSRSIKGLQQLCEIIHEVRLKAEN
jgi:ABC-type Fe3+-hydroxamate transport system substrate-binding protein